MYGRRAQKRKEKKEAMKKSLVKISSFFWKKAWT